jgi:DNA gyrase/topoisomerase IV subunit A
MVTAILVSEKTEQLVITSAHGQIIKLPIRNIPQAGSRITQGVILMRFAKKSDHVAAITAFNREEDEETG